MATPVEPPRCRSCDSVRLACIDECAPFAAPEHAQFSAGKLWRCLDCALGQRHPAPPMHVLQAQYENAEPEAMDYPFESNAAWVGAREILQSIFPAGSTPRVIDVGCHTGRFLAGLPATWRRFGIESGVQPGRIASEHHGVEIIAPRIEAVGKEWQARFDVVTLFDVVEHLLDPADGLARAARLLRPGGTLLLSSGNLDAWTWRWLRGAHWYLQTPQHVSFVSARFLRGLAARGGLSVRGTLRIPHQVAGLARRSREALELAHWTFRGRKGWARVPHRLIQTLPGFTRLRHRLSVPWTMSLRDHLLVELGA